MTGHGCVADCVPVCGKGSGSIWLSGSGDAKETKQMNNAGRKQGRERWKTKTATIVGDGR